MLACVRRCVIGCSPTALTLIAKTGNAAPGVANGTFYQLYHGLNLTLLRTVPKMHLTPPGNPSRSFQYSLRRRTSDIALMLQIIWDTRGYFFWLLVVSAFCL